MWTLSSPLVDDLSIAWIVQIRPFPSGDWRYCMRVVLASLYLISVNPLKIEVYTHITCLTHTLLTHKGSPVLIISTISTELACHIMALTVGNTAMQNVEPDPQNYRVHQVPSWTLRFNTILYWEETDLLQWRPLSPLRYWISLMHLLETQHGK